MASISFYGSGYCGDCDTSWEFGPVDDGTLLESDHEDASFYGGEYCADCDTTQEFGPVNNGTILEPDHVCGIG